MKTANTRLIAWIISILPRITRRDLDRIVLSEKSRAKLSDVTARHSDPPLQHRTGPQCQRSQSILWLYFKKCQFGNVPVHRVRASHKSVTVLPITPSGRRPTCCMQCRQEFSAGDFSRPDGSEVGRPSRVCGGASHKSCDMADEQAGSRPWRL